MVHQSAVSAPLPCCAGLSQLDAQVPPRRRVMRLCVGKRGYKLAAGGGIVDQRLSSGAYHLDRRAEVLVALSAAMQNSTSEFPQIL
jgi:hypothetical protein